VLGKAKKVVISRSFPSGIIADGPLRGNREVLPKLHNTLGLRWYTAGVGIKSHEQQDGLTFDFLSPNCVISGLAGMSVSFLSTQFRIDENGCMDFFKQQGRFLVFGTFDPKPAS